MEKAYQKLLIFYLDLIIWILSYLVMFFIVILQLPNFVYQFLTISIVGILFYLIGLYMEEPLLYKISLFVIIAGIFFFLIRINNNLFELYVFLAISTTSFDIFSYIVNNKKFIVTMYKLNILNLKDYINNLKNKLFDNLIIYSTLFVIAIPLIYITPKFTIINSIFTFSLFISLLIIIIYILIIKYLK